jgi:hypothetical protein
MMERLREQDAASFAHKNDCAGCHVPARPDATMVREYGLVHRGTDASGFFVPQTILADSIPIEDYGAFDANVEDPAVVVKCPGGPVERTQHNRGARLRCADGSVPRGRLDWTRARADDRDRVDRLCAARAFLVSRLEPGARAAFASAMVPCEATRDDEEAG